MKRDLTLTAPPKATGIPGAWRRALPVLVLVLAWLVAWYGQTARAMVDTWARSETYAHGFVVVPIVLWLVYRMRDRLREMAPTPSWKPLPLLAAAGFAWLLGQFGAVNALSQLAFVAILVLAVTMIVGTAIARALMFPLGFLFFAVPIGDFLLPVLMERTADFTIMALRASGVPVYREGLQFVIPTGRWSIIEACSGVRYLIASLMTGTLFAYVSYRSPWRRLAFVGVAIAVPIVANWLRAYMIVMIGHLSNNELATGIDHVLYGWLFFGVVMLLMFGIGARWREAPAADAEAPSSLQLPTRHAAALPPIVAGLLIVSVAWPLIAYATRTDDVTQPVHLPPRIDVPGWSSAPASALPRFAPDFKAPSATLGQALQRAGATVGVYIAYYRGQDLHRKLVSSENVLVPSTGSEWTRVGGARRDVAIGPATQRIAATTLRGPGERRLLAWQWYWIDGTITSSDVVAKARIAWLRLTGHGDDAAAIIVYAPSDDMRDASGVLQAFARDAGPALDAALTKAQAQR